MSKTPGASLNQEKKEAFAGKLIQTYNHAAVTLMISMGHRTGLFDTMSRLEPSTSEPMELPKYTTLSLSTSLLAYASTETTTLELIPIVAC